jgi:hypothetical protein
MRLDRSARRAFSIAVAACAGLLSAATCTPTAAITIVRPSTDFLTDDAALEVFVQIPNAFDATTVEVRLDGVDLIDALGLAPPFNDEAGAVVVGPHLALVSGFTYDPTLPGNPKELRLVLAGLPAGSYGLQVSAIRKSDHALIARARTFSFTTAFAQALRADAAVGLAGESLGASGSLAAATLGDPFAAPPVGGGATSELRPGFAAAAGARTQAP